MYNKVISKIRFHQPNKVAKSIKANINHLVYIATRDGVDYTIIDYDNVYMSNDFKQQFQNNIRGLKKEKSNPVSQNSKPHGLFGNFQFDTLKDVEDIIKEKGEHKQTIYRGIVSLCEEDAAELGYFDKIRWKELLDSKMDDIAKEFGIDSINMRWVAAFHYEKGHPHVHYMFWDSSDKISQSYIPVSRQHKCREIFSKQIYEEERRQMAKLKQEEKNAVLLLGHKILNVDVNAVALKEISKKKLHIMDKISNRSIQKIEKMTMELVAKLPRTGRLNYRYLPNDIKLEVNAIVEEIFQVPAVKKELDRYLSYMEKQYATYSSTKQTQQWRIDVEYRKEMQKRMANLVLRSCRNIMKENEKNAYLAEKQRNIGFYHGYKLIRAAAEGFMHAKNMEEQRQTQQNQMTKNDKIAEAKRVGKIKSKEENEV